MVARATLAALLDNFSRQGVGQHVQTATTLLAANTQTHVPRDGITAAIIKMTKELLSRVAFGHQFLQVRPAVSPEGNMSGGSLVVVLLGGV